MNRLISAELLKLRTTRSGWLPYLVAFAIGVLSIGLAVTGAGHHGNPPLRPGDLDELLRAATGQVLAAAVFFSWLVLTAGEFRHRTAVTTFTAEPRRLRVVAAKGTAAALAGAVAALAMLGVAAVLIVIGMSSKGVAADWTDPHVWSAVATVPLVAAAYGVLGVGLGFAVRNLSAAVGGALLWALLVEGILPVLLRQPGVVRWLPGGAAKAALSDAASSATSLSVAGGLAVIVGYAVVAGAVGAVVTQAREVSTAAA